MVEFIESILEWVNLNMGLTITWSGIVAFGGAGGIFFAQKLIPILTNKIKYYLIVIVAQLLGGKVDEAEEIVKALPLVKQIDDTEAEILVSLEAKLIDYKIKLTSGALIAAENFAIQVMYDKIYKQIETKISATTKEALEKLNAKV
jgi:hypothetical protein